MALPKWLRPWKTNTAHPSTGPVYPATVEEIAWDPTARPVYIAGLINTTQNAIRNAGLDTFDEFWYRNSSYNMTSWALWMGEMLEFFHAHNAQSAQVITTATSVTTGAAAATLTCAAGHAYKVVFASTKNDTRATAFTLVHTPNGGTATTIVDTGASTGAAGVAHPILGGQQYTGVTLTVSSVLGNGAFWLQAGDTLVVTQGAYVGGDTVEHNFVYEDYTL